MGTNSYNNEVRLAEMAMDCLNNNLTFTKYVNRRYAKEFSGSGAKHGDTFQVRLPGNFGIRRGSAAQEQGYNDTLVPITVSQFGADIAFTSIERQLFVEDGEAFKQNVLNPLIAPVANEIDALGLALTTQIPNFVGTPGTLPTDIGFALDAGALLDEYSVPRDGLRSYIMGPRSQASIVNGSKGLFHASDNIEEQYKTGNMGDTAGFKFSMDQNIKNHLTGTFGTSTPLMNGATADGASQIVTNGWASGASTLNKGDIVSIDGVYAINPVSKQATTSLKQFVVTEAASDSGGAMTIKISPSINLTGNSQNVSALPVTTSKVYVFGKNDNTYSNKRSVTDIAFHRDAFGMISLDMYKPESAAFCKHIRDTKLGISMRITKDYDVWKDKELTRIDVLIGWAIYRPNFACRAQG